MASRRWSSSFRCSSSRTASVSTPALGDVLLRGRFATRRPLPPSSIDDVTLQDAAEETLFSVQSNVDDREQKRFERAQQQADRYVEDRLLVLQKRRLTLAARLEYAQQRQQGATGSVARTEADARCRVRCRRRSTRSRARSRGSNGATTQLFRRYQEHIQQRRYTPPQVERVFDLELVIE